VIHLNNTNEADFLNCVRILMKDDQEYVKLYLIDSLVLIAQNSPPQVKIQASDFSQ